MGVLPGLAASLPPSPGAGPGLVACWRKEIVLMVETQTKDVRIAGFEFVAEASLNN